MASRGRLVLALTAALLALPQLVAAAPLPPRLAASLLGPQMIRAEILVKANGNPDFQLNRGRIAAPWNGTSITLQQVGGESAAIAVSANATVTLNGKPASVLDLRRGMQVAVSLHGNQPADVVVATRPRGPAPRFPAPMVALLLGDKLVQGEIAFRTPDGTIHDYWLVHGRIRALAGRTLSIVELTGDVKSVPIAADARISLNGRPVSFSVLRRGMNVTTIEDGASPAPAFAVYALRKR
jgi:hypothetical protein